jgi:hypothetical protein
VRKTDSPGDTSKLPNPADFPLGSPESRATARLRAEEAKINCIIIHPHPRNSELIEDAKGAYKRVFGLPLEDGVKPIGQTVFERSLYEVYSVHNGINLELFPKVGDTPLPQVRLPDALIILRMQHL